MRFTFRWSAPHLTRFTPSTARGLVGQHVALDVLSHPREGVVTGAELVDNGTALDVTLDVPGAWTVDHDLIPGSITLPDPELDP